jgi:antitoxin (DNA-binding transcriptional repressor) of toxin-antitoxin stability system
LSLEGVARVAIMATLDKKEGSMRQVSLREFRTRGVKALESIPKGETVLLSGQQGPAYFLVPVMGDVVLEDRELRRAMAKETNEESPSEEAIQKEISQVRSARRRRKAG